MEDIQLHQFDTLLSAGKKTVAMFYADWCPFCQKFKPIFESAKSKYKMVGAKINEDENPLWDRFAISSIPTIIAFEGNKIVARRDAKRGVGLKRSDLDSMLKELKWD